MKIWIVLEHTDYDSVDVVAAYPSEALADEHVAQMGGWVSEQEVRPDPHPDVNDPIKQADRAKEKEDRRAEHAQRQLRDHEADLRRQEVRPSPGMMLCHCETFSRRDKYFINPHGYCSYCGGFTPEVFRAQLGEETLKAEINKLAVHDRIKMREICGLPNDEKPFRDWRASDNSRAEHP